MNRSALPEELTRLREVVDDWSALEDALSCPLPRYLWANPLKIDPASLAGLLREEGLDPQPLPWNPLGFRLPAGTRVGDLWSHAIGLFHIQDAASMVPVLVLDPRPGERVIDLCAAPGNKTAQISVALAQTGTVVANDLSPARMRGTRNVIERLGLLNVSTTIADAGVLPRGSGLFDRVLADVPCSAEGRGRGGRTIDPLARERLIRRQSAILDRAVRLCRPGGRIVYSTCTLAPEENELNIEGVLRRQEGRVRLLPTSVPGLPSSPGLTRWQGRSFGSEMEKTLRLWPHRAETGGFFVAHLERTEVPVGDEVEPAGLPETGVPFDLDEVVGPFEMSRNLFAPYRFLPPVRRGVYIVNEDHRPPPNPVPDATGLLFVNHKTRYPKLTTAAAMIFGVHATEHVVELEPEQLTRYLARQSIELSEMQLRSVETSGYVVLRYRGHAVGMGMYRARETTVESLFPKAWSIAGGG